MLTAAAVEFREALFGGPHDGGDALAEAALVLQADHVALAQDGKIAGGIAGEQARGLQFLAPQADHQRLSRQVGVQPDVLQGADGHGGAGRIDGHAAAVGVGDGDHAIHVGEARQDLGADALRGVLHGGRDALHRGGEAEDVLGAGAAIGVAVALEGVAVERRQRGRDGGGQGERVERRRGGHVEQFLAHPTAGGDGAVGDADGLAVTQHRFAGFQVVQGDLVRLRNALARHESIGQERAGRRAFGVHQDGDIVAGVYANVHQAWLRTSFMVPLWPWILAWSNIRA